MYSYLGNRFCLSYKLFFYSKSFNRATGIRWKFIPRKAIKSEVLSRSGKRNLFTEFCGSHLKVIALRGQCLLEEKSDTSPKIQRRSPAITRVIIIAWINISIRQEWSPFTNNSIMLGTNKTIKLSNLFTGLWYCYLWSKKAMCVRLYVCSCHWAHTAIASDILPTIL